MFTAFYTPGKCASSSITPDYAIVIFSRCIKGTVSRDFQPSVLFVNQALTGPWILWSVFGPSQTQFAYTVEKGPGIQESPGDY